MIHIVAIMTAIRGQREAVVSEFLRNLPTVLLEPGCVRYIPVIDVEGAPAALARLGPDAFMVIEEWATREAVEAHAASAHMVDYAGRVEGLLLSRVIYALQDI